MTPFTMTAMLALSTTFTTNPTASPPVPAISATTASTPLRSRSHTTTLAPSRANLSAVAWPIPRAEPVIMHTLSFSRIVGFSLLIGLVRTLRPMWAVCSNGPQIENVDRRAWLDQVEQLDDVAVMHADAADRSGTAHHRRIRAAVDVDIAAHGIHFAQAIEARLTSGQPQDARKNPVAARKARRQLRGVDLPGRAAFDEHGIERCSAPDSGANKVPA